VPGSAA
ncbi:hypothetical protein ECPA23_1440, partial [Escherichia coli PA23]